MDSFQNTKDTFYVALRDRLAALNPERTTVVRGATRAALLVEENELAAGVDADPQETFLLRWTERGVDATGAAELHRGRCELRYAVSGSGELAAMDRGRVLDAMDAELLAMLQPAQVLKQTYAGGEAVAMTTNVFWSDATFAPVKIAADRLLRTATVDVFAWKEGV